MRVVLCSWLQRGQEIVGDGTIYRSEQDEPETRRALGELAKLLSARLRAPRRRAVSA
jgi:hypothetical protein